MLYRSLIFKGIDEFIWCDFLPQSYCAVLSVVLFIKKVALSFELVDEK